METRFATTDAVARKRKRDEGGATDTSGTLGGKRNHAMADAAGNPEELRGNRGKRYRVGDIHLAFAAAEAVAKEHTQWRDPELKARWDATHASPVEGVDVAISAWTPAGRNRVWGRELSDEKCCMRAWCMPLRAGNWLHVKNPR